MLTVEAESELRQEEDRLKVCCFADVSGYPE